MRNMSSKGNEMKDVEVRKLREKEAVKGSWKKYFENLMNVKREQYKEQYSDNTDICIRDLVLEYDSQELGDVEMS